LKKIVIFISLLLLSFSRLWGGENYLLDSRLYESELRLTFKHKPKGIKHFIIPAKGFTKYVYDIQGGILPYGKTLRLKHSDLKAFRIGQYSKNILRVVIESDKALYRRYKISGRYLTIPIPKGKKLYRSKKRTRTYLQNRQYKIILDAGHGGRDNGASCCHLSEKKVTLRLAKKLYKKLKKKGYRVYMTRWDDRYLSLLQRTKYGNQKNADIFVSIHVNAAPKKKQKRLNGLEVYHLSMKNSKRIKPNKIVYKGKIIYTNHQYRLRTNKKKIKRAKKLSFLVKRGMLKAIGKGYAKVNVEDKGSDFWVLLGTKMPSILVETGYLTHKKDRKRLNSDFYQNLVINGIINGIDDYFRGKR
jgi:N-acetylmuramoyl-L-alanine amidase